MVKVTVLRGFLDLKERVDRVPGETFTVTPERAATLLQRLPKYVRIEDEGPEEAEQGPDLDGMTVAQLRALAEQRGVELPKRAKKAEIIERLKG